MGDWATDGDLRRAEVRLLAEVFRLGDEWVCLLTLPSRYAFRAFTCFSWLRMALISWASRSCFASCFGFPSFPSSPLCFLSAFVFERSPSVRDLIGLSSIFAGCDWSSFLAPFCVSVGMIFAGSVVVGGGVGRRGGDFAGESLVALSLSSSEKLSRVW